MKKFTKNEVFTFSNFLSSLRMLVAIPLWLLLDNQGSMRSRYIVVALCLFAAITDILDGYFARKLNQVTEIGKIIDPLADKIGIAAVIIKMYLLNLIPAYFFFMIIVRDIIIFAGGIFVSLKLGRVLPSNILGKVTVIIIGIVILLILMNINEDTLLFAIFYYSSIILIFISLIGYIIRAKEFIIKKRHGTI